MGLPSVLTDLNAKTSVQRWDMIEKVCKKQYVEVSFGGLLKICVCGYTCAVVMAPQ